MIISFNTGMSTSFMPLYMSEISTPATQNVLGISLITYNRILEMITRHRFSSTGLLCPVGINLGLFIGQVLSLEKLLGKSNPICYETLIAVPH